MPRGWVGQICERLSFASWVSLIAWRLDGTDYTLGSPSRGCRRIWTVPTLCQRDLVLFHLILKIIF